MLEVKCFTTIQSLNSISSQWEELLGKSLHDSYSLSWSWISHWMNVYLNNNKILCIAVYEGDKLVGLGPFWVEQSKIILNGRAKILRFLGSRAVCGDHLDLIVHQKNSENICKVIWDQLVGQLRKEWDIWEYHNVPVDSCILKFLRKVSYHDNRYLGIELNEFMICPYINLPVTWELYRTSLSVNQRRALKVSTDVMQKTGTITFKFCETVQDLPLYMETHIRLHRKSWNERGQQGSFGSEQFRQFHFEFAKEQLKAGNLFLCNIELDNIPVGSFYGFVYNNELCYYLIGVDRSAVPKASIGRVLIARCIEEAIKRGYRKFDFLRGFENYKYDWTATERAELLVTFHNRSAGALLFIFGQFASRFGRQLGHLLLGERMRTLKRWFGKGAEYSTS